MMKMYHTHWEKEQSLLISTCRDNIEYFLNRPTKVDDPHAFGSVILAAIEFSKNIHTDN